MRSSRGKWVLAAGLLVGTATMLAVVAMYFLVYVDWRATQHQMMWSKREAHGPWPKDRVGQAVIVSFPGSGNLTTIEKELAPVLTWNSVGYFDGSECVGNRCSMFMYGPRATEVLEVVRPILKQDPVTSAATVLLRLGPPTANPVVLLSEKL